MKTKIKILLLATASLLLNVNIANAQGCPGGVIADNLSLCNSSNANTANITTGATTTTYSLTLPLAQGAASTVLTNNGSGTLSWETAAGLGAWSILGNSGTTAGTNFLGTTDVNDLVIKTNNTERMRVLSGGNVGIGTTSPFGQLTVVGSGQASTGFVTNGSYGSSITLGDVAGSTSSGGTVLFSSGTGVWANNGVFAGIKGTTESGTGPAGGMSFFTRSAIDNSVTSLTSKMIIMAGGNVGIGTTNPARLLEVNGQMRTTNDSPEKPNAGSWSGISDQRLKQNIAPFADGIAVLRQVNPVTFKFNGIGGLSPNETHIGVIAQDIMPVAPYCVKVGAGKLKVKQSESQNFSGAEILETLPPDSTGEVHTIISPLTYNYDGLIYVMINSIKQLDSTNTVLEKKDSIKDTKLQAMQDKINQLDSLINSCCSLNTAKSMQMNSNSQSSANSKDVELSNKNIVVLDQNVPNPFAEQTVINYSLPDNITRAQIIFLDQSGKLIKTVDLTEKGKGTLNVFANDLSNGIYTYSLIVDGQTVETKKMVKAK